MLRAYTGVSASEAASREAKDRLGQMAYIGQTPFTASTIPQALEVVIPG
jgi:hypothetical protein